MEIPVQMEWGDQTVDSFEDFVRFMRDVLPSTGSEDRLYWFRGQSDASWKLEPSLMRSLRHFELSLKEALQLEEQALGIFRCKAHLFLSPTLLAKIYTKPCWWAVMQHHGAPTRMLDWTISPYVAAYFAALHDGNKAPGAVWAFCSKNLHRSFVTRHGQPPEFDDPAAVSWYEGRLQELRDQQVVLPLEFKYVTSERIAAQQGRFTMGFDVLRNHNECIQAQVGDDHVRKIVIPHEKKAEFLLRLRDMNITGAALFPGIDGLGQAVSEYVSVGARYGPVICAQEHAAGKAVGRTAGS
ncbi:MAG TPA: FRG domain-containing protein [Burkholderiales bacterium]|nr:FRG domain-containing protein [Burkholderiales bacterium]